MGSNSIMYKRGLRALTIAFALTATRAAPTDCALFGPDFPAPRAVATDPSIAKAIQSLNQTFASYFSPTDKAYSVAVFSLHSNETLWEYHHTPASPFGVKTIDGDSIYRIGSLSKIFTVWTMLIELGESYLDRSIVDFVPELQPFVRPACLSGRMRYDDIERIRWEDITLRDLASHAAGIPRDLGATELPEEEGMGGGLPSLAPNEAVRCGSEDYSTPCTGEDFFIYVTQQSPSFPSSHSPAYSNNAFFLLSEAFKNITGKDLDVAMGQDIFKPLGMTHTTFSTPPTTDFGVIPGNDTAGSGWSADLGTSKPGGALFSSTNDLIQAGRALMSSALLPPAHTRRWFDYATQSAYLNTQVGTPWERTSLQDNSTGRLITLYTKGGDVASYHAKLVLSLAHDIGYVVLTANTTVAGEGDLRGPLTNVVGDVLIPAMEAAARREATINYAGRYTDEAKTSSIDVSVDDGRMGLGLGNWTTNGTSTILALNFLLGLSDTQPRLYPTTLKSVCAQKDGHLGQYVCRTGWRAVFVPQTQTDVVMDPCLGAWGLVGGFTYGGRGVDDWVFDLGEDGKATALNFRAARLTLKRSP